MTVVFPWLDQLRSVVAETHGDLFRVADKFSFRRLLVENGDHALMVP